MHHALPCYSIDEVLSHPSLLPSGCRLIEVPEKGDERGSLCFVELKAYVPFSVERAFWISQVPEGKQRGGHAHNTCAEVVFPVSGAFTMQVDNGRMRAAVRMDKVNVGIVIPAGMWCDLLDFSPSSVCVVFASQAYDATGYIHDYQQYKELAAACNLTGSTR